MIDHLSDAEWERVARTREDALDLVRRRGVDLATFTKAANIAADTLEQPRPIIHVAPGPLVALEWVDALEQGGELPPEPRIYSQVGGRDSSLSVAPERGHSEASWRQRDGMHMSWWRHAWATHWGHVATLPGVDPVEPELLEQVWAQRMLTVPILAVSVSDHLVTVGPFVDLHIDNEGALHREDGPAWTWPDGTTLYALEGIAVPGWVVTAPDASRILSDLDNAEQRRVAFSHLGWDKAVEEINATVVDAHDDPHLGTLYDLPVDVVEAPARLLIVRNASPHRDGTWQTYGLLCDVNADSVEAAHASLARISVDEWRKLDGAS